MPCTLWLRYNPDGFTVDGVPMKEIGGKAARETRLCEYLDCVDVAAECGASHMCIRYMNYDTINGRPSCTLRTEFHPEYSALTQSI